MPDARSVTGTIMFTDIVGFTEFNALRGDDLVGHDVNVASRIMNLAGSGEVLASEATVERADSGLADVQFERLGPVVMKGIPTPINLYRAERI